MSSTAGAPGPFAERMKELIDADGRPQEAIAREATRILSQRKDPRTGNDPRTGRPPRSVDKKRITEWKAGRETPTQTVLDAVLEATIEHIKGRKGLDVKDLTAGLLNRKAWKSWLKAAQDARPAEPWLEAYLDAARCAAETHPYPGVLPEARLPPLSQVYVRQWSRPRPAPDQAPAHADPLVSAEPSHAQGSSADSTAAARLTAEAILDADHDVLLLGGPGAGKSSLLRHVLVILAAGAAGLTATIEEIPVYVPVSYLTISGLSFAEQLYAAVRDELSGRWMPKELPADIFSRPPRPAARWLVLLDGLDDPIDVRQRIQLTQLLHEHRAGPYRFVITTRPLPEEELGPLERDPQLGCYELLPFDPEQLHEFAEGWMRAAHDLDPAQLPDPEAAVRVFLDQVAQPPLAELAQIPLIATILCQVHAAGPDQALPRDRYSIYQSFLDLLRQRLHDPQVPELPDAILATLRGIAAQQYHKRRLGRTDLDLLGRVLRATDELCPPGMPPLDWARRRTHLLRRTGLVTARGESYTFIHQTISEFLAAQHVAADARLSRKGFRDLFGWRGWAVTGWSYHGQIRRRIFRIPDISIGSNFYVPPPDQRPGLTSYHRFLIAAWHTGPPLNLPPPGVPPRLTTALRRLARRRHDGVWSIAELAADGVALPQQIIDVATGTLTALATQRLIWEDRRLEAAEKLVKLGDPRADTLAVLAADPGLSFVCRIWAMQKLVNLADQRGGELLTAMATDPTLGVTAKIWAMSALVSSGDPTGGDLLVALATDPTLDSDRRVAAAKMLTGLGDRRGGDLLAALASDPALDDRMRVGAAERLAHFDYPRAASLLKVLATDRTLNYRSRLAAAEALAEPDVAQEH